MLLRLNWPSSTSPGNRHQPAAQPRPLKVAEARKSACASPSRRSLCRKPQDHVGMTLPRPRIALSFATTPRGSQIRRSPRLLVCRKPTLSTGIAPAMASNASWEMAILTMTPDMGTPRASRQNSPREGRFNAGANAHFCGADQMYAVATRRPARLFRQQVPCQPSPTPFRSTGRAGAHRQLS
jgi:hypothetical protein